MLAVATEVAQEKRAVVEARVFAKEVNSLTWNKYEQVTEFQYLQSFNLFIYFVD